jgi:DNA primase
MIPDAVIQEVKGRVDSLAVLGRHLQLRRSGDGFVAPCPFHEDRSPSLHVYPDGRFHCFGCGAHGDVFGFLQRMSGKPFPAIVRELAVEVGVELRAEIAVHPASAEHAEASAACETAQRHFEATLWSAAGEPGRKYLQARGISEATARTFRLGYADGTLAAAVPENGHALARGFLAAGLLEHARGGIHARLCARVTLPLVGNDGRVAGFSARAVVAGVELPYLTTRETAAFRGSRSFFGIEEAAPAIRKGGSGLLLSGYFDVLGAREAGVLNAFAVPSLSTWHIEALRRRGARELARVLSAEERFDPAPDLAAAVFASLAVLRVVRLPPGAASAESVVRSGGRAPLEGLLTSGVPLSEYLIDEALRLHGGAAVPCGTVEAKLAAVGWLAPYVRAVRRGLERSIFERRVAQRLHLPLRSVRAAAKDAPASDVMGMPPRRRRSSARRS